MCDLEFILVVDATNSMNEGLHAIKEIIGEVTTVCNLVTGNPSVTIGVVTDYVEYNREFAKGGCRFSTKNPSDISIFITDQLHRENGGAGGGQAEAYKTSLNLILQQKKLNKDKKTKTIVFFLCDNEPHGGSTDIIDPSDKEGIKENEFLTKNNMIISWPELCQAFATANISVFTFLLSTCYDQKSFDTFKTTWQRMGDVISIHKNRSEIISSAVLCTLNAIIDQLTKQPIKQPTKQPTEQPTKQPTEQPTEQPTKQPTEQPTKQPTEQPDPELFSFDSIIHPIIKIDTLLILKNANPKTVIDAFDALLDPKKPSQTMCITTNPIIGKFWRQICGYYKFLNNEQFKNQCDRVCDKFSQCMKTLPEHLKIRLQVWLDITFNKFEEIRRYQAIGIQSDVKYILIFKDGREFNREEIKAFGEKSFVDIAVGITNLECVPVTEPLTLPEDEDSAADFIPTNIKKIYIFKSVAHLLSPGLMFSNHKSFMVAILALKSKALKDLAHEYLSQNVGKWINWELRADGTQIVPLFWSKDFFNLLKLAPDELLTPHEIGFRDHYLLVSKVISNHNAFIPITQPHQFEGTRECRTWKRECKAGCGLKRPFALFPGDSDICALCINVNFVQMYPDK